MSSKLVSIYPQYVDTKEMPKLISLKTTSGIILCIVHAMIEYFIFKAHNTEIYIGLASVMIIYLSKIITPAIRSLHNMCKGIVADLLFMSPFLLFMLPYVVLYMFFGERNGFSVKWLLVAVLITILLRFLDGKTIKRTFNRKNVELMSPLKVETVVLRSYMVLGSALCEELLYRGILIKAFGKYKYGAILIVSIYFMMEHFCNRWAINIKKSYYLKLILISTLYGTIYYFSKSLTICIIVHLLYDLPIVIQFIYRYHVTKNINEYIFDD